jgi:hypothetical protein
MAIAITTPQIVDPTFDPALQSQSKLGDSGNPGLVELKLPSKKIEQQSLPIIGNSSLVSVNVPGVNNSLTTITSAVYVQTVSGPNNSVEFVENGVMAGSSQLSFDPNTNTLSTVNAAFSGDVAIDGAINLGDISYVTILGGSDKQVLTTDGLGDLSWQSVDFLQVPSDWSATTGNTVILNKPTIPTNLSQLYNDSGYMTTAHFTYGNLIGKPNFSTVATSGSYNDLIGKPSFATVATTGYYSDLIGSPMITNYDQSLNTSDDVTFNSVSTSNISGPSGLEITTPNGSETSIDLYTDWSGHGVEVWLQHNDRVSINTENGAYDWSFDNTGTLNFPTTSNITLAAIRIDDANSEMSMGTGTGNLSIWPGTGKWLFDTNGKLTVPGDIVAQEGNDLKLQVFNPDVNGGVSFVIQNRQVDLGNDRTTQFEVTPTDIKLTTDFSGNKNKWVFGQDGNLTLPTNSSAINYANGTSILSGFGGGGGTTLPSETGNAGKYLTTDGSTLSWATVSGGGSSYDNSNVVTLLTNFGSNTITTTGNITAMHFIGNGNTLSNIYGPNVSGQVSNALIAGTVYTNAQPNITSVGILSSLDVTANITSGNAKLGNLATSNYFVGNGSLLTGITASLSTATTTITNGGTTTLTHTSATIQLFLGTASGYSVVFPNTTTMTIGSQFTIVNKTSVATLDIKGYGGAQFTNVLVGTTITFTCVGVAGINNSTEWAISTVSGQAYSGTGGQTVFANTPNITSVGISNSMTSVTANIDLFVNGSATLANLRVGSLGNSAVDLTLLGGNTGVGNVKNLYIGTGANLGSTTSLYIGTANGTGYANFQANTQVNISNNLTVTGNVVGGGVRTTTSSSKPANPIPGDIWYNSTTDVTYRYTNDGVNSYWLDITGPAFTGPQNTSKVANYVDAGVPVIMDNLKIQMAVSGNRSLQIASVSGTYTVMAGGYGSWVGSGTNNIAYFADVGVTVSTSMQNIYSWSYPGYGDTGWYHINDVTNHRFYRVTFMVGSGYNSNFISIERLI